ncbi:MAG: hypothetical protein LVQ95_02255 [Candidatus Micrarchaeales archaeon]|nr:hypothetical protein [Candidatus Micrarchaeales archaeon]
MGQIAITSRIQKVAAGLSQRERLIVMEIGLDSIDSASSFVGYMSESYGFSKSSVWYNLNRLKEKNVLDFATKDEPGKLLALTKVGVAEFRSMERAGIRIGVLEDGASHLLPMPNDQVDGHRARIVSRIAIQIQGGL